MGREDFFLSPSSIENFSPSLRPWVKLLQSPACTAQQLWLQQRGAGHSAMRHSTQRTEASDTGMRVGGVVGGALMWLQLSREMQEEKQ